MSSHGTAQMGGRRRRRHLLGPSASPSHPTQPHATIPHRGSAVGSSESHQSNSTSLSHAEVHTRATAPQYVDWSVSLDSPPSRHDIQRVPLLTTHEPAAPLPSTAAPPPVTAARKKARRRGLFGALKELRHKATLLMFADFPGAPRVEPPPHQQRLLRALDALALPNWYKPLAFGMLTFFTRTRVYLVLLIVLCLLGGAATRHHDVTQALGGVASTFRVAEGERPGLSFLARYNGGSTALPRKHPVVIIPGFISTALELWEARQDSCVERSPVFRGAFRQRMFGPQMLLLLASDPACWLELFSMDRTTGKDKPGLKVRADTGFSSADYFMPGYWVWAKVLINLADIGYDPQSMAVVTYDWRLSPTKAHERDGLFYYMRQNLKFLCQKNREAAVVISHSYGTTVALAFFRWAERREAGFMNKYVRYFVNVGGVTMGLPKALSALLMGDARDTIAIPRAARLALDTIVSQRARYNITRTWSCLTAMLPHGCGELWDGTLLNFDDGTSPGMRSAAELIMAECARSGHTNCKEEVEAQLAGQEDLPVLPQAPQTTVVCLYGVNKPTEGGYRLENNASAVEGVDTVYTTNTSYSEGDTVQGVRLTNGDGTVPLLSLGYMCRAPNGWKRNAGRVVTIEQDHRLEGLSPLQLRGGVGSGDHVDILGNYDLLETILKVVSGVDERGAEESTVDYVNPKTLVTEKLMQRLENRVYSDIDHLIQHQTPMCLAKTNQPIQPTQTGDDDNPYL